MRARRELLIASEGIPVFFVMAAATAATGWFLGFHAAVLPFALLVVLFLVFRDPIRRIPADPLGIVSPVDGTVTEVTTVSDGAVDGSAHCICIRVHVLGSYTARCPVEGKVMELRRFDNSHILHAGGLWVRTDEGADIVLQFRDNRFGLVPRAFLEYGERVGQGERFAWLRLTRAAEVQLPASGRVLVRKGERVRAGTSVLARLSHS